MEEDEALSNKSKARIKTFDRTIQSALDHTVTMGSGIANDLRKSFAMASKGPTSMLGKSSKRGTVINHEYRDAEERRVFDEKAAAKRGHKAEKPKARKPSAKRPPKKGSARPSKRERSWDYEVLPSFFALFFSPLANHSRDQHSSLLNSS